MTKYSIYTWDNIIPLEITADDYDIMSDGALLFYVSSVEYGDERIQIARVKIYDYVLMEELK